MSLSISATAPTQPANAPAPAPAPTPTKQPPQPQLTADTVILSLSAQAIQLTQQGKQPLQIASKLGIPLSTVDSYLGITSTGT